MLTPPGQGWNVERIKRFFPVDDVACSLPDSAAAAPGSEILAVAAYRGRNYLVTFNWGLVPSWAENKAIGVKLINARSETLSEKPSFRKAFEKRRCLIIAQGFIEFFTDNDKKSPIYFTLPDNRPMGFAGLWEKWRPRQSGAPIYRSCTIITTGASKSIQPFHHRMPVVLKSDQYPGWLDTRNRDLDALSDMLRNKIHTQFEASEPPEGALAGSLEPGA